jgi:serine phosphatase RsbU (regulator of sigma subunit)
VAHTDGLEALARLAGEGSLNAILAAGAQARASAQEIADRLLSASLALEQGRPTDDISVLVLAVVDEAPLDGARRLTASFPFV